LLVRQQRPARAGIPGRSCEISEQTTLRKDAGTLGLLYVSVGSIVGSGWLFAPMQAARQAGALSIGSWLIGAAVVLLMALVYSELGTLIPRSGALVHISSISHGRLVGIIWTWMMLLSYITVPPLEVMAAVTYANDYVHGLIDPGSGLLTNLGLAVCIVLLGLVVALNFLVIRRVLLINDAVTWWKLAIPASTVIVLAFASYHPENLRLPAAAMQHDTSGMFTAVVTSGIIFSYFGFRQAVSLAGETTAPARNVPLAVIGSVFIALLLYLGLQFAFMLAVQPAELARGGWQGLRFEGYTGSFAAVAVAAGATWWAAVLYINAIVSPAGTALISVTLCSRVTMATGEIGAGPRALMRLNADGVPWVALVVIFVMGALSFLPFPSWRKLVSYMSSLAVLSYGIGPIVLLQLRRVVPHIERPFRLRAVSLVAPTAFIASNWIVSWSGLATLNILFEILLGVFALYLLFHYVFAMTGAHGPLGWAHAWWLLPYFAGLWLITALGPPAAGGDGTLTLFESMGVNAVFSMIILWIALATTVPDAEARRVFHNFVRPVAEGR